MLLDLIQVIVNVLWVIIFVQAIMSWLIAFNVINTYNDTVRTIWNALTRLTDPLYNPIRRILPDIGGLDLSPLVVLVILSIISNAILPRLADWYQGYSPL